MSSVTGPNPLVGKSTKFPFQVAIACWIDLLGYGKMIAEAEFNPMHSKASEAMARLQRFDGILASHSSRHFPTLTLNDGAVAYRDLSLRGNRPTYEFLMCAWQLFKDIQADEANQGQPGARMVMATGFRMRGRKAGQDAMATHFKSIMRRYQSRKISAAQAIHEAAHIRQSFDIVPQLQANFAFSKAYVAERDGTKGGLKGANMFVDLAIFDEPTPSWIQARETVAWSNETLHMKASFAPVIWLPPYTPSHNKRPIGIRDGLAVAKHLTQDQNVLRSLQIARKPGAHRRP